MSQILSTPAHSAQALGSPNNGRFKQRTGDVVHASGTIVHWDVRDPDNPYYMIGITCRGCKLKRFVHKQSIRNPSWRGLCSKCLTTTVAKLLKYPDRHSVYKLKREGKLKAVSLGDKTLRFSREEVRRFIQERTI